MSLIYSVDLHEDPCDHNLEEVISGPYLWIIFDHASLLHYGWSRLWQPPASIFIPLDSPVTAIIDITDFYFLTCCFSHHTHACSHFHSSQTVQMYMFLDRPIISTTLLVGILNLAFCSRRYMFIHHLFPFLPSLEFPYPDLIDTTYVSSSVCGHFFFSGFDIIEWPGACHCMVLGDGQ